MINKIEIFENYISTELENEILNLVPDKPAIGTGRNQIIRYGSKEPYSKNVISDKIPEVFNYFRKYDFDSVTINEYFENQSIPFHIDKVGGGPIIVVLNLLGGATIEFQKPVNGIISGYRNKNLEHLSFWMPRLSLVVISDELRYDWSHSVTAGTKRYSVVFRNSKYVRA